MGYKTDFGGYDIRTKNVTALYIYIAIRIFIIYKRADNVLDLMF